MPCADFFSGLVHTVGLLPSLIATAVLGHDISRPLVDIALLANFCKMDKALDTLTQRVWEPEKGSFFVWDPSGSPVVH